MLNLPQHQLMESATPLAHQTYIITTNQTFLIATTNQTYTITTTN